MKSASRASNFEVNMAAPLKVRLAQAHGMNARWCHQALEEIKRLEKKGDALHSSVAFIVNHMPMSDSIYDHLLAAVKEYNEH